MHISESKVLQNAQEFRRRIDRARIRRPWNRAPQDDLGKGLLCRDGGAIFIPLTSMGFKSR